MNQCFSKNVSDCVDVDPFKGLTVHSEEVDKYFITSDYLIYKGFLLRKNNKWGLEWYKDDIIIKSPSTGYYAIYTGEENDEDGWKYIWYTDEVDQLVDE